MSVTLLCLVVGHVPVPVTKVDGTVVTELDSWYPRSLQSKHRNPKRVNCLCWSRRQDRGTHRRKGRSSTHEVLHTSFRRESSLWSWGEDGVLSFELVGGSAPERSHRPRLPCPNSTLLYTSTLVSPLVLSRFRRRT